MKYASLLLGYLLLIPYGASAREEPVENRIVSAFNSLPAALKNSVPPIELLFVNDFKGLQEEMARRKVTRDSDMSPAAVAIAYKNGERPAIVFVKSFFQMKENDNDNYYRRVVTHEVMHIYDYTYEFSKTPNFMDALKNDKLLHNDWVHKYKDRQGQNIYDFVSYFLKPTEAYAEAGAWLLTRYKNQHKSQDYWSELFPNSILETCSSLAKNMIVTKDECWYLSVWITR